MSDKTMSLLIISGVFSAQKSKDLTQCLQIQILPSAVDAKLPNFR